MIACLVVALLANPNPVIPEATAAKVLKAHPRGAARVVIDGRLDEGPWLAAPRGAGFTERTPTPGAPVPVASSVRVLFDADAVYVGVQMALLPGETPKAFELRRDNTSIWSFDAVTVKFDPRHDRRTTLGFAVNPAGAQIDLIALDNGKVFRVEHDALWEVATQVDAQAWTAEYRIPASALGVRAVSGEQVMGLQVSRDHAARVSTDDWAPMPPGFGAVSALHYGELRGVEGLGAGRPFAVIPYVLGAVEDGDPRGGLGGEARVQIGGSGWFEASVRTDFAEVDLDDALVNLDRFPLFFPERRPFFLNGLDVFEFGESGLSQLFFSRRIGLDASGGQVPIHTGLKIFQRDGKLRAGAMSVLTGDHAGRAAGLFSVGRGRVEVGDGHVGAMIVHRTDVPTLGEGDTGPGHVGLGLDGQVRLLNTRLQLEGSAALTMNSGRDTADDVVGERPVDRLFIGGSSVFKARWRGRNLRPGVQVLRVDAHYDPQVGFVRRRDIIQTDASAQYVWLNPADGLRTVDVEPVARVILDADGQTRQGLAAANTVSMSWMSGWRANAAVGWEEDRVAEAFELADRVEVPAGVYEGAEFEAFVASPGVDTPDFQLGANHDAGYFGGSLSGVRAIAGWYLGSWVRLGADVRLNRIDVPQADPFWTTAVNSQITVTPSAQWVIDTVGQYVSVRDRVSALMRLRWRWTPGSDLFVVYREAFDGGRSADRRMTLKATWWIDGLL